jgi:ATP-dependent Clp protease protease subunit
MTDTTNPPTNMLIPTVIESDGRNERAYDIFSRMLNDRIIFVSTEINQQVASVVVAQMLHLASVDPDKPIKLYICSPGGSVYHGLAIVDCMQNIPCQVHCIALGLVASMGTILLGAGEVGYRSALPNARMMIHQVSGGFQGQASDIEIQAKESVYLNKSLHQMLADYTGQKLEKIEKDANRDFYLSASQAVDYGLVDKVIDPPKSKGNKAKKQK